MEIWTLIIKSNTFNFAILVVILAIVIKFCKIGDILAKAQAQIKETIDKSDEARKNAQQELKSAQDKVENVPNQIKELEEKSVKNIELVKQKIQNETIDKIENIQENTKKILEAENRSIVSELSKKTGLIAFEIAKNHIKEVLSKKPEYHQKFIDESIQELETGLK